MQPVGSQRKKTPAKTRTVEIDASGVPVSGPVLSERETGAAQRHTAAPKTATAARREAAAPRGQSRSAEEGGKKEASKEESAAPSASGEVDADKTSRKRRLSEVDFDDKAEGLDLSTINVEDVRDAMEDLEDLEQLDLNEVEQGGFWDYTGGDMDQADDAIMDFLEGEGDLDVEEKREPELGVEDSESGETFDFEALMAQHAREAAYHEGKAEAGSELMDRPPSATSMSEKGGENEGETGAEARAKEPSTEQEKEATASAEREKESERKEEAEDISAEGKKAGEAEGETGEDFLDDMLLDLDGDEDGFPSHESRSSPVGLNGPGPRLFSGMQWSSGEEEGAPGPIGGWGNNSDVMSESRFSDDASSEGGMEDESAALTLKRESPGQEEASSPSPVSVSQAQSIVCVMKSPLLSLFQLFTSSDFASFYTSLPLLRLSLFCFMFILSADGLPHL